MEQEPERDAHGRMLAHRDLWRQALTLNDGCALAARWFEGELQYMPGRFEPDPGEEAARVGRELAAITRAGLFVQDGQAGERTDAGNSQREFVTGFCDAGTAAALTLMGANTDLVVLRYAPGSRSDMYLPVNLEDGETYTSLGRTETLANEPAYELWVHETNSSLAAALAGAWFIEAVDPAWGRSGVLLAETLKWLGAAAAK